MFRFKRIIDKMVPSRTVLARVVWVLGLVTVGFGAYVIGRSAVPAARGNDGLLKTAAPRPGEATDYQQRVVAYIHDTIPITREELGEFLIARFGAEHVETLVKRKVVELKCKSLGIQITDAMVEAEFLNQFKAIRDQVPHMTLRDFEKTVLGPRRMTLVEFKEDVIRPKLMVRQYVLPMVQVTQEDLVKGFEGRFGPKVECRMIVLPDNNQKEKLWEEARQDEKGFVHVATTYNMGGLAAHGGKVPPIHKHFGDPRIERIAFGLREGEVSPLIGMPDKTVIILKCDRHIPADTTKRFEQEATTLLREIEELKVNQKIMEAIQQMTRDANPKLLLRRETRQEDLESAVSQEIPGAVPTSRKRGG
jgi:hypothetical protein